MKYQEALLELGEYTVVLSWSKNQTCSINELNEFKLLQEAIDKAQKYDELMTPKKVKVYPFVNTKGKYINESFCGSCDYYIDRIKYEKYCFNCGQALKWSNVND